MQNKSIILSAAIFVILFGASPHSLHAGSNINKSEAPELSDSAAPSSSDLQEVEATVKTAEEKLRKRQYEQKAQASYGKMHEAEMRKCRVLKSEIWQLRDSVDALAGKSQKLRADRKQAHEVLAGCEEASNELSDKIKAAMEGIAAKEEQFKKMSAAVRAESDTRKEKIDNLQSDMKSLTEKITTLQTEKVGIDNELNALDVEYKAEMNKLNAFKNRLSTEKKEDASINEEMDNSKKKIEAFMAQALEREGARQKLMDESLAAAVANKTMEEAISVLEADGASKAKELGLYSAALETEKKTASLKIKKLQKDALDAKSKQADAGAALKKIDGDIKVSLKAEHAAEKELSVKMEDLKVRVSVLVGKMDQDGILKEVEGEEIDKKPLSKGAELSADIKGVFDAMKYENDRLMAENKAIKAGMKRAEADLNESRRNALESSKKPEELRIKLNKERLEMHYNLAIVYEKNGMYDDAEREYLKCLKIDPKDPGVHYNLGILYDDKLNKNSKAMDHYWKFLLYRPIGETAERVRDWITKLELEKRLGKEVR